MLGRTPRHTSFLAYAALACLVLIAAALPSRATVPAPAGKVPVPVSVRFFLLNLNRVDEKNETFEADIYIGFRWKDERLKHGGKEPLFFAEDAARAKLEEIWSPQVEFVNTAKPDITNEVLNIEPDGTVFLQMGLTSEFRADFDLRRFPFDHQHLDVVISSFAYTANDLVFEADQENLGYTQEGNFEGSRVTGLTAETSNSKVAIWNDIYSNYRATISIDRNTTFYFYTVFGPVVLIFLISCAVYLVPPDQFSDRVSICITALLACIATQFALSFNLPQISYLTLIDRLFVNTYAFIALNVLIISAEMFLSKRNENLRRKMNHAFGIVVPIAYLAAFGAALIF